MGGTASTDVKNEISREFITDTTLDTSGTCRNYMDNIVIGGDGEDCGNVNIIQECYNKVDSVLDTALTKVVAENKEANLLSKGGVLGGAAKTSVVDKSRLEVENIVKHKCLSQAENIINSVKVDRCDEINIKQIGNNYAQCSLLLLNEEYVETKSKIKAESRGGDFTALFGMIAIIGLMVLLIIKAVKT